MKKILLALCAGSLLVFNSCTKTGPQGPIGPQGPQGNANVVGSDPFTVNTWQYDGTSKAYYASFSDPDITADVAAHGVVEVFLSYTDGTWRALPDVFGGTQFYDRFSQGGFEIYFANVDGSTPSNPGSQVFRSVVIYPSQRQAHPNTNWRNYNEVMAVLNETKAVAPGTSATK